MKRFDSILVATALAVATLSLAPVASGNEAVLWGCHGPAGQALGAGGFSQLAAGDGVARTFGAGCGGAQVDGGLSSTFNLPNPSGGSMGAWQLTIPAGATLESVSVDRQTTGFGGAVQAGDPMRYFTVTPDATLESSSLGDASNVALNGTLSSAASGSFVRVGTDCPLLPGDRCDASSGGLVGVNFGRIAAKVRDDSAPNGAVGGVTNPAVGTLKLSIRATDVGLGLTTASASIDGGAPIAIALGSASCTELSPGDATTDFPVDAACPVSVMDDGLDLDTTPYPDGPHQLKVVISDAASNVTTLVDQTVNFKNIPDPQHASATLTLGNSGLNDSGAGGTGDAGGGTTTKLKGCLKPKLSVRIASKHVRFKSDHPVLVANRHYLFSGRLTCLVAGHRHSAPRLTRVEVINVVHGRWLHKRRTLVRRKLGRVTAIRGYQSNRVLEFRYRSADHVNAHVRIKLYVVAKGRP